MLTSRAESQGSRVGNTAGMVLWAMSMILMSIAMALRGSGLLTGDQFTTMTCVVMVVVAVGIGGYTAVLDATAENRVRPVCGALTPGMSVQAVTTVAEAHGMYAPRDGAMVYYIGEKATGNSFGCLLRFKERVLESSTYSAGGRE